MKSLEKIILTKELIVPERFDIVIKKRFLKSLDNGGKDSIKWRAIYQKKIILRTLGVEPPNPSGDFIEKNTPHEFVESFIKAYKHFKNDISQLVITTNQNFRLIDGAHRLAIASHLQVPHVKVKVVQLASEPPDWGLEMISSDLFTLEEKVALIELFANEFRNMNLLLFWGKQDDNLIKKKLSHSGLTRVAACTIKFDPDLLAFSHLIYELYDTHSGNKIIQHKLYDLLKTDLSLTLMVVREATSLNDGDVHSKSIRFKQEYRQIPRINKTKGKFNSVHCADSEEETRYILMILKALSRKNHYQRVGSSPNVKMIELVKHLKETMREYGIEHNNYCVVGSAALGALNLVDPSDIDVIVDDNERKKFTKNPIALSKDVDIVTYGYHRSKHKVWLSDNEIIHDDDNHFWFHGVKICNLDLVLDRKRYSARHKDILHANIIEHYLKFISTTSSRSQRWEELNLLYTSKIKNDQIINRLVSKLKRHIQGIFNRDY